MESQNFTHHFLIAMPAMADPNFSGTVTYICEHNDNGAIGLIVNRPSETNLSRLMSDIEIPLHRLEVGEHKVMRGGPVQTDRGFVLHAPLGKWGSSLVVADEVAMTTSKDILIALGAGDGPEDVIVTMGYAGWSPGQLEEEIAANAWLTVPADTAVLFRTPIEERFHAAIALLGIKPHQLAMMAGHA
jgi:putative transcriptional regulator